MHAKYSEEQNDGHCLEKDVRLAGFKTAVMLVIRRKVSQARKYLRKMWK